MSLPTDLRITLASAGISIAEPDLAGAITRAIGERRGYFAGPDVGEAGFVVELLSPERVTFEGRTETLALAWCLIYLMGETGEIGIGAFCPA